MKLIYVPKDTKSITYLEYVTVRWMKNVARMGDRKGVYRALVGRTDGERLLGRSRPRRENGIKMDFQEVGWGIGTGLLWLEIGTGGGRL